MGPTNLALYRLFKADQQLRDAEARLESVERNVRIQERRVADLNERSKLAQTTLREQQTLVRTLELDLASRDVQIERFRGQQQAAKNNREYQALLIEINTAKVDRLKTEEQLLKTMELAEKSQAEAASLHQQSETEKEKLETMRTQIHETAARARSEVDTIRPERAAAAAAVPPRAVIEFDRLAEHHEGEALAALGKPDRRREEYVCLGCNMELAQDVYNKLHSRDEMVFCPSCRRLLYLPDDLTHDQALGATKAAARKPKLTTTRTTRTKAAAAKAEAEAAQPAGPAVEIELRAKGLLGQILAKAQAESVQSGVAGGLKPLEFEVIVNETLAGIYKGKSGDHLERSIRYFMAEANLAMEVRVVAPLPSEPVEETPAEPPAATDESRAATADAPVASEPAEVEGVVAAEKDPEHEHSQSAAE